MISGLCLDGYSPLSLSDDLLTQGEQVTSLKESLLGACDAV